MPEVCWRIGLEFTREMVNTIKVVLANRHKDGQNVGITWERAVEAYKSKGDEGQELFIEDFEIWRAEYGDDLTDTKQDKDRLHRIGVRIKQRAEYLTAIRIKRLDRYKEVRSEWRLKYGRA